MTELTQYTFEDRDFRFTVDEKIVAADLAQALGYRSAPDMTRSLDDDEKGTQIVRTPGGDQEVTVVTEAGFYRACLTRQAGYIKDAAAKEFVKRLQRWVTHTVLPSIRKTGSYGTAPQLTEAQIVQQALAITHRDLEAAKERLALVEPRAAYVEKFVADEDLRLMRNVAKSLGMQEKALRDALLAHGWIYCEEASRWSEKKRCKVKMRRYSPVADKRGWFRPVPQHEAPRFRGEVWHCLKVTPAGAVAIARAAARWGLIAGEEVAA